MRLGSFSRVSLLAPSALAALLGCSTEGASSPGGAAVDPSDTRPANTESHDDPIDAPEDLSWAQTEREPGTAALRVLMTDAPIEADNVFVTFCGIYVVPATADLDPSMDGAEPPASPGVGVDAGVAPAADAGAPSARDAGVASVADGGAADPAEPGREAARRGGWQRISDQCQTLDLLTLRDGITEAVGIGTLPPGDYGQLRLMLVKAAIVVAGLEHELTVPSGAESGLKIGHGFSLVDGSATTLTLDFDAGRSVRYAPGRGFIMAPVIDVVGVQSGEAAARDTRVDSAEQSSSAATRTGEDARGSGAGPRAAKPPRPDSDKSEPRGGKGAASAGD